MIVRVVAGDQTLLQEQQIGQWIWWNTGGVAGDEVWRTLTQPASLSVNTGLTASTIVCLTFIDILTGAIDLYLVSGSTSTDTSIGHRNTFVITVVIITRCFTLVTFIGGIRTVWLTITNKELQDTVSRVTLKPPFSTVCYYCLVTLTFFLICPILTIKYFITNGL